MNRRTFLAAASTRLLPAATPARRQVNTVRGPVKPAELGITLIHEHILVDFIGAKEASPSRYDADEVFRTALPKLNELRQAGCRTLVECTPAFLGRDPRLLRRLSEASGLHLITNTGLYGANRDRHVPRYAYSETALSLAKRWTDEYKRGIERTGIRPGFLKIGVDAGPLSDIDAKLVSAGALCHKTTGLRLHVHTGNGEAAMSILDLLSTHDVPAAAYVWVHAQSEKDRELHIRAAKAGAWVEFDGINPKRLDVHVEAVVDMIERGFLRNLLISHDSGWYRVGEPGGGEFNGYTYLFEAFLPKLRQRGVTDSQIRSLLEDNPARALTFNS
jgi:predicted metal-dependent phosphotriesterase family hydrolase